MSQFSKARQRFVDINQNLIIFQNLDEDTLNSLDNLRKLSSLRDQLQDLRSLCDNYVVKAGQLDPINNLPRFGPTMISKINELSSEVDNALLVCTNMINRIDEDKLFVEGSVALPELAATVDSLANTEISNKVDSSLDLKIDVDDATLHIQAEEIRERKRKHLEEEANRRLEVRKHSIPTIFFL
jgi:hypothetical protein